MRLPNPKNQLAECLLELLTHKRRSRLDIMNSTRMLCVTSKITRLRLDYNLPITTHWVKWQNKYGRMVQYGEWSLEDFNKGIEVYNKINME